METIRSETDKKVYNHWNSWGPNSKKFIMALAMGSLVDICFHPRGVNMSQT